MSHTPGVTVAVFGTLQAFCGEHDPPSGAQILIPDEGTTARRIAREIGLPVDRVDGVFRNHRPAGLDCRVERGDRVAFVPIGTPATHPAFFGDFDLWGR
jgi:hypothetical protein